MTTYHVHPTTGDNGDDGLSEANAWATIQYALTSSAATAGDTITIHGGTYNERIVPTKSGTAGNPITIVVDTGETATLGGASGQENIIVLNSNAYLTFDGLYFSYAHAAPGGNKRFAWIQVYPGADHIIFQNCEVERPGWEDIADLAASTWDEWGWMIEGTNITLSNCTVRGVSQGVQWKNLCYDGKMENCDFGNTLQSAVTLTECSNIERRLWITGCTFHDSAIEDGVQFMNKFGSATDYGNAGAIIENCIFYDNWENAIDLKGASRILMQNCIIYRTRGSNDGYNGMNRSGGTAIWRGASTTSKYIIIRNCILYDNASGLALTRWGKIYNCTVVANNRDYTGSQSSYTPGFVGLAQRDGSNEKGGIKNCIMDAHTRGDIKLYAAASAPNTNIDIDYNLYTTKKWLDASVSPEGVYTSLSAWRTRLLANNWDGDKEQHSIVLNNRAAIQFVSVPSTGGLTGNYDAYDWGLLNTSPAKGKGGWLTRTNGAGSASTTLVVDDAGWFYDGMGRIAGDTILLVDPNDANDLGDAVVIDDIDYDSSTITLTAAATWGDNYLVYYGTTRYPDIGAPNYGTAPGGGEPPAPEPTIYKTCVVTRVACNTSTGNQTITLPSGLANAPKAVEFLIVRATTDGTAADGLVLGYGAATSTTARGAGAVRSEHGTTDSDTSRRGATDSCVLIADPNAGTYDGAADFVSMSASQVVINWTDAPASAYLLEVRAWDCTNAHFEVLSLTQTVDTANTVTAGFQADFVRAYTRFRVSASATNNNDLVMSYGWATISGTTPDQRSVSWSQVTGTTAAEMQMAMNETYIAHQLVSGALWTGLLLENITATEFDLTTKVNGQQVANADCLVLAMEFSGLSLYTDCVATPTSVDADYEYSIGFQAGYVEWVGTMLSALTTVATDASAGTLSIGSFDGVRSYTMSGSSEDGSATMNTQSLSDDVLVNVPLHTGAAGIEATLLAVRATAIALNFQVVDSTARYAMLLVIEGPANPTVTAAFSADDTTVNEGDTVTFTDASTDDGATIDSWLWDFGDTGTSTSQNPTHVYSTAGAYTVTLTVSDTTTSVADSEAKTEYITVSAAAAAPATTTKVQGGAVLATMPGSPRGGGAILG